MTFTLVSVAALILSAPASKGDPIKAELKALEGTWELISMEEEGQPAPEKALKSISIVIKDDKLMVLADGKVIKAYVMTLDPTKKPKTMDWKPAPGAEEKGKEANGIYKLDGGQLTICLDEVGQRPTEFKGGDKRAIIVLKRPKR